MISKEASEKLKEMMVKAVVNGEAKFAAPKGYRIAGKTGTAQIPVAGHYDDEKQLPVLSDSLRPIVRSLP